MENVIGVNEYDLGSMDFKDFDFGEDKFYSCTEQDVCRPDIISYRIYGTVNYWAFLMWYNGITDIWNDIRPSMIIRYPDLELVREAHRLYAKEDV